MKPRTRKNIALLVACAIICGTLALIVFARPASAATDPTGFAPWAIFINGFLLGVATPYLIRAVRAAVGNILLAFLGDEKDHEFTAGRE